MKKVESFELIDCGVDHSQYFIPRGVSGTDFDVSFTGIGYTPPLWYHLTLLVKMEKGVSPC